MIANRSLAITSLTRIAGRERSQNRAAALDALRAIADDSAHVGMHRATAREAFNAHSK